MTEALSTRPEITHDLGASCLRCRRRPAAKGVYCGFCMDKQNAKATKAHIARSMGRITSPYSHAPAWAKSLIRNPEKRHGEL